MLVVLGFRTSLKDTRSDANLMDAEVVAQAFNESKIRYTPLAIQRIIETINAEAEGEVKR